MQKIYLYMLISAQAIVYSNWNSKLRVHSDSSGSVFWKSSNDDSKNWRQLLISMSDSEETNSFGGPYIHHLLIIVFKILDIICSFFRETSYSFVIMQNIFIILILDSYTYSFTIKFVSISETICIKKSKSVSRN